MQPVIDIHSDLSLCSYYGLTTVVPPPDFVKTSEFDSEETIKSLRTEAFGDVIGEHYPLHNKSAAWLSALYFYGQPTDLPESRKKEASSRIDSHMEFYGLKDELNRIKEAFSPREEVIDKFAIDMGDVKRCPCHTKEAATKSATWLYENRLKFPLSIKRSAAALILKEADLTQVDPKVASYVERLAMADVYTAPISDITNALNSRLRYLRKSAKIKASPVGQDIVGALRDLHDTMLSESDGLCEKAADMAETIENVDLLLGVSDKWGKGFDAPEDICLKVSTAKLAEEKASQVSLTNGKSVDLSSLSDDDISNALSMVGSYAVDYSKPDQINLDRSKVAELLPTLPKPDANLFLKGLTKG
jgi:hypothetical protein